VDAVLDMLPQTRQRLVQVVQVAAVQGASLVPHQVQVVLAQLVRVMLVVMQAALLQTVLVAVEQGLLVLL
jgi:hypothetical protein